MRQWIGCWAIQRSLLEVALNITLSITSSQEHRCSHAGSRCYSCHKSKAHHDSPPPHRAQQQLQPALASATHTK